MEKLIPRAQGRAEQWNEDWREHEPRALARFSSTLFEQHGTAILVGLTLTSNAEQGRE